MALPIDSISRFTLGTTRALSLPLLARKIRTSTCTVQMIDRMNKSQQRRNWRSSNCFRFWRLTCGDTHLPDLWYVATISAVGSERSIWLPNLLAHLVAVASCSIVWRRNFVRVIAIAWAVPEACARASIGDGLERRGETVR